MTLLPVPSGDFLMGSDARYELAEPDEQPQRRVALAGFWIDATEVTRAMYAQCVEQGPCPGEPTVLSPADSGPQLPQSHVSWQDAEAYCQWAGRTLPTEAQWERAARGHDGRRYPWGWIGTAITGRDVRLNFCDSNCPYAYRDGAVDDGAARQASVGSYPAGASPVGALDMAGNVWEWVADWYRPDYYQVAPLNDPLGPEEGRFKGIRGGSWTEPAVEGIVPTARSANRAWQLPDRRTPDIGFRCAVSAEGR